MITLLRRCFRRDRFGRAFTLTTLFFLGSITAGQPLAQEESVLNPHGDSARCAACHGSTPPETSALRFEGNVSDLCIACHDGRRARAEMHPVQGKPSQSLAGHWPADFPLTDQRLTCLTCHDVRWHCRENPPETAPRQHFLRGPQVANRVEFCFLCHAAEAYSPFNVHDQLAGDQLKTDSCLWCHIQVPDRTARALEGSPHELLSNAMGSCSSCHPVAADHPVGDTVHMHVTPSEEFRTYMAAYEMTAKMSLPLERLLNYVRTSHRPPRGIPLDEQGRITCYSCHNPHERGVLPTASLRAVGADTKKASHHRARIKTGDVCIACHQK